MIASIWYAPASARTSVLQVCGSEPNGSRKQAAGISTLSRPFVLQPTAIEVKAGMWTACGAHGSQAICPSVCSSSHVCRQKPSKLPKNAPSGSVCDRIEKLKLPPQLAGTYTRFEADGEEYAVLVFPAVASPDHLRPTLTEAEQQVVQLVLQGFSNEEIGATRSSSPRTVANQLQAIYRKLGIGSRVELARAVAHGRSPPIAAPAPDADGAAVKPASRRTGFTRSRIR